MITTTLTKIREHSPCEDGYIKLCKNLGGIKKYGTNTPIKFSQILDSNGLEDALWCLRTVCPEHAKEVRLYAADCAERVLHFYEDKYPECKHPRKAIQAARDFAEGKITEEELDDARIAARAATEAAIKDAAGDAAGDAAWAATWAAWDAWAATRDATEAARIAAEADEQEIQIKILIERFG